MKLIDRIGRVGRIMVERRAERWTKGRTVKAGARTH